MADPALSSSGSGSAQGWVDVDVNSALLGDRLRVVVAQPPVAEDAAAALWVWLLHGFGAETTDVTWLVGGLAEAMATGELGPCTIAAPVGSWSKTAWWVDSADRHVGRPVESAVINDVLPAVERQLGPPAGREQRMVAGLSMGGGAAVVWSLRHPELFGSAALAAPAAFADTPLAAPTPGESYPFGIDAQPFSVERWTALMSYQRLLTQRGPESPRLRVATVVGDAEVVGDYPSDTGRSSLTLEAAKLHVALTDAPGITSSLRVVGAGHTWDFWIPGLAQAVGLARRPATNPAS
jgi:pimeloyl-ACP methyl ester carboxylesterase